MQNVSSVARPPYRIELRNCLPNLVRPSMYAAGLSVRTNPSSSDPSEIEYVNIWMTGST